MSQLVLLGLVSLVSAQSTEPRSGGLSFVGRAGESDAVETMVEGLFPVVYRSTDVVFVDLRGSRLTFDYNDMKRHEEEFNGGIGYRHLFNSLNTIVGANAYYDRRSTIHSTDLEQLGLGVEVLSPWIDLRANYYNPENGARSFGNVTEVDTTEQSSTSQGQVYEANGRYERVDTTVMTRTTSVTTLRHIEEAMDGYDAEVGVAVPWISQTIDTRVIAGYYHFDSDISSDVSGPKWRIEVRPVPAVLASMEWYGDYNLNRSDYFASLAVTLPFSIGELVHGRNPFRGTRDQFQIRPRSMQERMVEPVYRDFRVRTKHMHEDDVVTDTDTSTSTAVKDLGAVPPPPAPEPVADNSVSTPPEEPPAEEGPQEEGPF